MRLWSIHPKYLDAPGLVACWREALLAKAVLQGKTKGYKHHPQLDRFRASADPLGNINRYLKYLYEDAVSRGYKFNPDLFKADNRTQRIKVTWGQMVYERSRLLMKLEKRSPDRAKLIPEMKDMDTHPLFVLGAGEIEPWEKI
jgi:hypothetical protein